MALNTTLSALVSITVLSIFVRAEAATRPMLDRNANKSLVDASQWTFFPPFVAEWLDERAEQNANDPRACEKGDFTKKYALILQGGLGLLSFAVLILKRLCEPVETRRTWTIWFLDTSKQGLGMAFMHVINVYLSETNDNNADPCTFYLTSFLLDTTVGLLVIWMLMKLSGMVIEKNEILGGLPFGEYERYSYTLPILEDPLPETLALSRGDRDHQSAANSISMPQGPATCSTSRSRTGDEDIIHVVNGEGDARSIEGRILPQGDSSIVQNLSFEPDTPRIDGDREEPTRQNLSQEPGSIRKSKEKIDWRNRFFNYIEFRPFSPSVWALQTIVYLVVTLIEKIVVYYILQLQSLQRFYTELRTLLTQLIPVKDIEIALVLFIIPFLLNCLMFWVIDNILMKGMGCMKTCLDRWQARGPDADEQMIIPTPDQRDRLPPPPPYEPDDSRP